MARVGRIAGSLLVETRGKYALVGFPKEPCDYAAHGLSTPPAQERWSGHVALVDALGPVRLGEHVLTFELEGEPLLQALAQRLLIARNGSVSERLWRLAIGADEAGEAPPKERCARWLSETPSQVWDVVRDTVLRCS